MATVFAAGLLWTLASSCTAMSCNNSLWEVVEDWDLSVYSCEGRCGLNYTSQQPCACDWHCQLYENCCEDIIDVCSDSSSQFTDPYLRTLTSGADDGDQSSSWMMPDAVPPSSWMMPDAVPPSVSPSPSESPPLVPFPRVGSRPTSLPQMSSMSGCTGKARLISVCPTPLSLPQEPMVYGGRRIEGRELPEKCQAAWEDIDWPDYLQVLPVSDRVTGHHFLNIYCFLCHGGYLSHAVPWSLSVKLAPKKNQFDSPQNVQQLLALVSQSAIDIVAAPPPTVTARRCGLDDTPLDSSTCLCPNLVNKCNHGPEAYIEAMYQLYRHFSCLQCAFIGTNKRPDLVQVPDFYSWTWGPTNAVFLVNLTWSSNPAHDVNASLIIKYHPRVGRHLFTWKSMTCQGLSENRDQGTPERSSEKTVHAEENTEETSTPAAAVPERGEDPSVEHGTGLPDFRFHCQQTGCNLGSVLVDGVCNSDLQLLYLHVHMTCVDAAESDPLPPVAFSLGPKSKLVKSSRHTHQHLTEVLKQSLLTLVDKAMVSNPSVGIDEERCYWEVSAEAALPKIPQNRKLMENTRLASTMYSATTSALSPALSHLTRGLLVCVRVHTAANWQVENGGPCAYSTVLWPSGKGQAAPGKGLSQESILLSALLLTLGFLL